MLETLAVVLVGGLVIWMIASQEREKQLRQDAVSRLRTITLICAHVTRSLELEQILNSALDRILEVTQVEMGFIYMVEMGGQDLVLTAQRGVPAELADEFEKPAYEFRDVKSYHVRKALNGADLFVIDGTVANFGKVRIQGIRIRAALLGRDNEVLASTSVFAGNHLDNTALRHASRAVIEGYLGVRYGEGNVNRDIPVGNSLPFMAVFFDPPQQFQSFEVNAQDAE